MNKMLKNCIFCRFGDEDGGFFSHCLQSIFVVYLKNKEASTVLCSVVKHAGSGRARKK